MYSVREVDVKFNILHKHRGRFRGGGIGWLATPLWSSKKKRI